MQTLALFTTALIAAGTAASATYLYELVRTLTGAQPR